MGGVICMETTADGTSALTIGVVLVVDHTARATHREDWNVG